MILDPGAYIHTDGDHGAPGYMFVQAWLRGLCEALKPAPARPGLINLPGTDSGGVRGLPHTEKSVWFKRRRHGRGEPSPPLPSPSAPPPRGDSPWIPCPVGASPHPVPGDKRPRRSSFPPCTAIGSIPPHCPPAYRESGQPQKTLSAAVIFGHQTVSKPVHLAPCGRL